MTADAIDIAQNLRRIRENIPPQTLLIAVSKNHTAAAIGEAYACGQRHFGESRPQELQYKAQRLPADIVWHFIGHLQRNKVKTIAPYVNIIHSIDSVRLLREVEKVFAERRSVHALLQVHIARERHKFGFAPQEVLRFFEENGEREFPHVQMQGLMGIATFTDDADAVRSEFRLLNDLRRQIQQMKPLLPFAHLSIGMTGDYQTAIEEGSTMVRIGSAIFGERYAPAANNNLHLTSSNQ